VREQLYRGKKWGRDSNSCYGDGAVLEQFWREIGWGRWEDPDSCYIMGQF
jgi:hypothetical protein